jgi:hypothetical protein
MRTPKYPIVLPVYILEDAHVYTHQVSFHTFARPSAYTVPKRSGNSFPPFPLSPRDTQTPDVPETGGESASLAFATADSASFCSCTPWTRSTGTITFKVRIALAIQTEYTVSFKLRNGATPQVSPPISIKGFVEAGHHDSEFAAKVMEKPGLAVLGVQFGTDPLLCIVPDFTTRTVYITTAVAAAAQSSEQGRRNVAIGQHVAGSSGDHGLAKHAMLRGIRSSDSSSSSGLPSSNVTVSLISNVNLQSSDGSTITLRGFTGMSSSQTRSVSLENFTINGAASQHVFSDGTTTGRGRYLGEDLTLTVISGKTVDTGAEYAFTFNLRGPGVEGTASTQNP